MFPQYPDLGKRLFNKMHKLAKAKTKHLGVAAFRQQCETYLNILDDALIHEHYVKMFMVNGCPSASEEQSTSQQKPQQTDDDLLLINTNGFVELLLICFRIGVATYIATGARTDVANNSIAAETFCPHVNVVYFHIYYAHIQHNINTRNIKYCFRLHILLSLQIKRTLESVTQSCFLTRDTLSVGFVCRWLENNLPNLIMPLHRFCVHTLTTVYRTIDTPQMVREAADHSEANKENPIQFSASQANQSTGDQVPPVVTGNTLPSPDGKAMTLSQSWLLAAALPNVFTRLQERKVPVKIPQVADRSDTEQLTITSMDAATNSKFSNLYNTQIAINN